jgi:hypothetical protein
METQRLAKEEIRVAVNRSAGPCELPGVPVTVTSLRKEMIAVRRRGAALLLAVALTSLSTALLPAPAQAAVDGVELKVTKVPDEFEAGDDPDIVEVVVSTDRPGPCQKVRWSLLVGVKGVDPDQVRVNRVEEDGSFPTQARSEGGRTRITDTQVDPGQLCRGRTVTGRYLVSVVKGAPDGEITFESEAFDVRGTLLQKADAASDISGVSAPSPSPSPSASESPDDPEPSDEAEAPPVRTSSPPAPDLAAGQDSTPSLLGPGLIVGAVLVFIGVGLLLRLRLRNRPKRPQRPQMPGYVRY